MNLEIGPQNLPDLLAGLGMLALAALVLWVAPNDRLHRAFALLQVVNGGGSLIFVAYVGFEQTDPALSRVLWDVGLYYNLAWPFAAAFFALRFLDPERRSRVSRPLGWVLLAGVVAILTAFALDHGLYRPDRPLGLVWYARPLTFGAIAFMFALGARRAEEPNRRSGLVFASLAFTLLGALGSVWRLVSGSSSMDGFPALPDADLLLTVIAGALPWLSTISILATMGVMVGARSLRSDRATRGARYMLVLGGVLSALSAFMTIRLFADDPVMFVRVGSALDGMWRVVMTVLLAYALLRRQLFDVQVKIRFAISKSTVAAVFIAVFFVASEAAQEFLGDTTGSTYLGIAAAGALVFAIAPLQRAAERLAERAVPPTGVGFGDTGASLAPADAHALVSRRSSVYAHAVRMGLCDGPLTREKEAHLAHVAHELGLPQPEAFRILRKVEEEGDRA